MPRKTIALSKWMSAKIDDVVMVKKISTIKFESEHGFLQVSFLLRTRIVMHYEMRSWCSDKWEGLLTMANVEEITTNSSYAILFDEIFSFIKEYEVIR